MYYVKDQTLIWSSTDETVVVVSDGVETAIPEETAAITATPYAGIYQHPTPIL